MSESNEELRTLLEGLSQSSDETEPSEEKILWTEDMMPKFEEVKFDQDLEEQKPVEMAYTQNESGKSSESVARPVQFSQLETPKSQVAQGNLDLLMDVPMPLVVELGRSSMIIRDILELAPGSIISLDKAAGEPVDLMINGKLIAKGEVVVIDESFGLRITEIIGHGFKPEGAK